MGVLYGCFHTNTISAKISHPGPYDFMSQEICFVQFVVDNFYAFMC